jgi:hypothetical protein
LNCPSKIEAAVAYNYGRHRVPPRDKIVSFMDARKDAELKAKRLAEHHNKDCAANDGVDYAPQRILTRAEKDAERRAKLNAKVITIPPLSKATANDAPRAMWPKWFQPTQRIPAGMMLRRIADEFGVTVAAIKGKERFIYLVGARSVFIRLMRERGLSYPTIGKQLGGRDHSTLCHSTDMFDNYCKTNPIVAETYAKLLRYNGQADAA